MHITKAGTFLGSDSAPVTVTVTPESTPNQLWHCRGPRATSWQYGSSLLTDLLTVLTVTVADLECWSPLQRTE